MPGAVQFLNVRALWLLALLLPLVALYILKVRRSRLRVGSTWLWREARRDLLARSPFRRLRLLTPLLLQAIAIIALALAASEPAIHSRALDGDHIALVIDVSASMSAVDAKTGKTRFALAKDAARDVVSSLPPTATAMLLAAGREPQVLVAASRQRQRLQRALAKLEGSDVEGDIGTTISLAVARLKQRTGRRRVIIISDGNLAHAPKPSTGTVGVELIRIGTPTDNAAIVRLDVRTGVGKLQQRPQVQAFLRLANYGSKAREVYVTMRQRNASDVLDSRSVVLPAAGKVAVELTFHPSPGDLGSGLIFDISPHDALPTDDVAFARVPQGRGLDVFLVSESEWLLRALNADPAARVVRGSLDDLYQPGAVDSRTFVVIDGACPKQPPGGALLLVNAPGQQCFGTHIGAEILAPHVTSWRSRDERLRFLTLDGVAIARARPLTPESPQRALITSDKGIIAADISTLERQATLLAFDVGESNWPLKASFVLFIRNLMEQARQGRTESVIAGGQAGRPLRAHLPAGAKQIALLTPGSKTPQALTNRAGLAVVASTPTAGFYEISWLGTEAGSVLLPVNLLSAAESNLRESWQASSRKGALEEGEAVTTYRSFTWLLALLALIFIGFDTWLLTRRQRRPTQRTATTTSASRELR